MLQISLTTPYLFTFGTFKFAAENRVHFQRGESNGAANQEKEIFLLCQISPSASSTRDLGTRLGIKSKLELCNRG